jgi:competence protein ComEC
MVLRLAYLDSSVLLEGDAEKQVERRVVALHHPSATLLKVGHHGSANATTPELVASARPQFAVISVGSGNSFGLPRPETLARLAAGAPRSASSTASSWASGGAMTIRRAASMRRRRAGRCLRC